MSAVPDAYDPTTDFSDYANANPGYALPGTQMDVEFDEIAAAFAARDTRAAEIQRDDGQIRNGIVGLDQLSEEAKRNLSVPTMWLTATAYLVGQEVLNNGSLYLCVIAHTSGTFATDLAALKWTLLGALGSLVTGAVLKTQQDTFDLASLSSTLPWDDSAPQSSEGTEIMTVSFTPIYNSSLIRVTFRMEALYAALASLATRHVSAAIFQGAEADAFVAGYSTVINPAGTAQDVNTVVMFSGLYLVSHTGALTFKVRAGDSAGNTVAVGPQKLMGWPGIGPSSLLGNRNSWLLLEEVRA